MSESRHGRYREPSREMSRAFGRIVYAARSLTSGQVGSGQLVDMGDDIAERAAKIWASLGYREEALEEVWLSESYDAAQHIGGLHWRSDEPMTGDPDAGVV